MSDFLRVNEILSNLRLEEGMMAAEFGCGSANFAIQLAKHLTKGRVYAIDIQEEKLSALKGKMQLEKLHNIFPVLGDLERPAGSTLHDASFDVVLIPNLLFQVDNKRGILQEAVRVLKSHGQVLVVDWSKESHFVKKHHLVSPGQVKAMAGDVGLTLHRELAAGDYHYVLVFTKN